MYHFGRYLQIRYDEQPKDDDNPDMQLELSCNITYIQQEAPQTLPNATPTPQLPDTPIIIPETQQQDEPEVEQEQITPILKEKIKSKIKNPTPAQRNTTKHSETMIKWWTKNI